MNIDKQRASKKGIMLGILAAGLMALGLAGEAKAAPEPIKVQFRAISGSLVENAGTVQVKLMFTNANLANVAHGSIKVVYQITGTASSSDFKFNNQQVTSGSVIVPAGTGDFSVNLENINDTLFENDETVVVKITGLSHLDAVNPLTIGSKNTYTHTILNDDVEPTFVQFETTGNSVQENSFAAPLRLKFTDSNGAVLSFHPGVKINFQITGTASTSDYFFHDQSSAVGTLQVWPGSSGFAELSLGSYYDDVFELDETVVVKLLSIVPEIDTVGFQIGKNNTFTHWIINDDFPLYLNFERSAISSIENQPTLNDWAWMTLTDPAGVPHALPDLDVAYQVVDGSTNVSDYYIGAGSVSAPQVGTFHLSPSNGKYLFSFGAVGDENFELDETTTINILNVWDADPTTDIHLGTSTTLNYTIVNDDFPHTVQFAQIDYGSATEGTITEVTVKVTDAFGNAYNHNNLHVHYQKVNGNATMGGLIEQNDVTFDYSASAGGTLQIPAGNGSAYTFELTSINDAVEENNEDVVIMITGVSEDSATFATQVGADSYFRHTIVDNDADTTNVSVKPVLDSSTLSRISGPDQTALVLGKWELKANNGPVSLRELTFQTLNSSNNTVASSLNTFGQLSLYDGFTLLDTASYVSGDIVFAGFNSALAPNTSKIYTVKASINSSGVVNRNLPVHLVVKSDNSVDFEARNLNGVLLDPAAINVDLSSTAGPAETRFAPSAPLIFHDAYPVITINSLGSSLGISPVTKVYQFTVTNAGTRNLRLSGVNLASGVSGMVNGSIKDFRLYEGTSSAGTRLANNTTVLTGPNSSATIGFNTSNDVNSLLANFLIAPGASKTFTVTADTTNMLLGKTAGTVQWSARISGSSGWNGSVWGTGNLFYYYTPVGWAEQGQFSASNSYPFSASTMSFSL